MTESPIQNDATSTEQRHNEQTVPSGSPEFRISNVLKIVAPVLLLTGLGVVFFGFFDGMGWLAGLSKPTLAPYSGTITYNGEPLAGAQIFTQPLRKDLRGAMGVTDDQGRFTLQTDVQGYYVEGAFAGEHLMIVSAVEVINAPSAPPLITPALYSNFETTPIRIEVSPSAENHQFTYNLEGDPPSRGGGGRFGGGGPPGGGGGRGGGRPSDADIVARILENSDSNADGVLSLSEAEAIDAERLSRMRRADADEDDEVTPAELVKWVEEQQAAQAANKSEADDAPAEGEENEDAATE